MKLSKQYIIAISLSVIIIVLIAVGLYLKNKKTAPDRIVTELLKPNINDIVFGNDSAQLAVYMYASYNCSHCRNFFTEVLPELQQEFLDTEKVKIVLRLTSRTTDKRLKQSLKALVCINKYGNYQYLHELLLNNYKVAYTEEFQKMIVEFIQQDPFVGECIDGTEAETYLLENIKEFEANKLKGTPTFIIENTIYQGFRNAKDFKNILKKHIKNQSTIV